PRKTSGQASPEDGGGKSLQKPFPGVLDCASDIGRRRAARALARGRRRLGVEQSIATLVDTGLDRLHLLQRKLVEVDAPGGGLADQRARRVMGLAERDGT